MNTITPKSQHRSRDCRTINLQFKGWGEEEEYVVLGSCLVYFIFFVFLSVHVSLHNNAKITYIKPSENPRTQSRRLFLLFFFLYVHHERLWLRLKEGSVFIV